MGFDLAMKFLDDRKSATRQVTGEAKNLLLVRDSNQPRYTAARVVRVPSAIAAQGDPIAAAAPRLANKSNTTFQWPNKSNTTFQLPCYRVIARSVPRSAGDLRGRPFAES